MSRLRIGIDVGGTFTDICVFDEENMQIHTEKVPSTPEDSSLGIFQGVESVIKKVGARGQDVAYIAHGNTVATNTLIQRSGSPTGLITTRGFRDLLEIARQTRPHLYDLQIDKPKPLVPRHLRLEVKERIYSDGRILTPLDAAETRAIVAKLKKAGVQAVAVCLLHSYQIPDHEQQIKTILKEIFPDAYLSVSNEIVPEFREYERLSTTVVNAYLGPIIDHYISRLERRVKDLGVKSEVYITQSNGGLISTAQTRSNPVRTVLSGPSTGVIGATHNARLAGINDIITFDMGGTSTDVCLVENGRPHLTNLRDIEGYTVKTPMIDIHTVGAGGGSIAWIDSGGHLKVGPQSAGSEPGPVSYGRGGTNVTVTDANVILQTLNPRHLLGGRMKLDSAAAKSAIADLARRMGLATMDAAMGIVSIVVSNMVRAVRVISVQRGYDPREFTLVAFGGAGPLHAGWVARELNLKRILIPKHPGLECAFGILVADMRSDFTQTRILPPTADHLREINEILEGLETQGRAWLVSEGLPPEQQVLRHSVDMRYQGQNFELNVTLPDQDLTEHDLITLQKEFHRIHEKSYGYFNADEPTQIVTYRVEAIGLRPKIEINPCPPAESVPITPSLGERKVYLGHNLGDWVTSQIYWREDLQPGSRISGPAVIEQMDTTTVILPGQNATVDNDLNLIITLGDDSGDESKT